MNNTIVIRKRFLTWIKKSNTKAKKRYLEAVITPQVRRLQTRHFWLRWLFTFKKQDYLNKQ